MMDAEGVCVPFGRNGGVWGGRASGSREERRKEVGELPLEKAETGERRLSPGQARGAA